MAIPPYVVPSVFSDLDERRSIQITGPTFAAVWLQAFAQIYSQNVESAEEIITEADKVLARYKEIYNGK